MDISKFRELSVESRKTKKIDRQEKYNKACEMAYNKILENAVTRMQESAREGNFSASIYDWEYVSDMKDTEKVEKSRFNNVWLLDILIKNNLIEKLETFFNKGNETADDNDKFKVSFRKDKRNGSWSIYVKWSDPNKTRE